MSKLNEQTLEEKLKRLAYLEQIIEVIPVNLYWKDREGRYQGVSRGNLNHTTHLSPDMLIGKTAHQITNKKNAERIERIDNQVMKLDKTTIKEEDVIDNNNNALVYLSIKTPLHDEQGKVSGLLGVSIDITQQKLYEKELKKEKENAERANFAKSEFLKNMSHDLKTPFTGILGAIGMLELQETDSKKLNIINDVKTSARSVLDLLNDILELSKLETGEIPLSTEELDFIELVKSSINLIRPEALHKNLQLEFNVAADFPAWIRSDKIRLKRILLNLLGNAIKFTHQGFIKISINIIENSRDNLILELMIEDTGIGIPADQHESIFKQFSRGTAAYSGLYQGSGIGLYVVKKFIEDLQGQICVESTVDQGSKFICRIPVHKSLNSESLAVEQQAALEQPIEIQHLDLNILLVEDNRIAQRVAASILEEHFGCRVTLADSGKKALEAAEQAYDMILMDIGLPDIDGIEISKQIRQEKSANKTTPIFGLTAHATEQDRARGANWINEFLSKPLTVELFNKIIKNAK